MARLLRSSILALLVFVTALGAGEIQGQTLRVMAANTSSGNFQSYPNPGPGTRIFQALTPDVVLIQELNVNATRNAPNGNDAVDAWVDDVFGVDYHWFREPGNDSIPNGVISRWPIVESGEWRDVEVGNRDFAFARIDIPGEVDLWVVSVHFLTAGSSRRVAQARGLLEAIQDHPVPEEDFLIIGGDFNTDLRNEPAVTTLGTVMDILGPFPDDGDDPPDGDTNKSRRKPYDWVLADAQLTAFEVPVEVGAFRFPNGLVFDSRVFSQTELDEHFSPVQRGDSGANQMQHMAVVRDFRLDTGPGPDFELSFPAIDFGTGNASSPPRLDSSVQLQVARPFQLTAAAFAGSHPQEFALLTPDLSAGPVTIAGDTTLTVSWQPTANDGEAREVTATLVTDGEPGAVEIALTGTAAGAGDGPGDDDDDDGDGGDTDGAPLDLTAFRLLQSGGTGSLVLPAGTVLPVGGVLVIGRAASRAEFEAFWGPLPAAAIYVNGGALAGDPGFPIINGGERYRLFAPGGAIVDPPTGAIGEGGLPTTGTTRGRAYQRTATDGEDFTVRTNPRLEASPGRYEGQATGTGRAVITEISDATGPGGFVFEFVEIFFDAGNP